MKFSVSLSPTAGELSLSARRGWIAIHGQHGNVNHRADSYWGISLVAISPVVIIILIIVRYSSSGMPAQTMPLLTVFVLMLTAALVQSLFYGISLVNIGMESVRQRVRALCGGDVIVDSAPGYGTAVTIALPQI